jgi:hypothetical protein
MERLQYFPTFYPFGPIVLTKFTRAEIALFFFCWAYLVLWSFQNLQEQHNCQTFLILNIPFGPVVLTKYIRAGNARLSFYLSHLVQWSSRNLQEIKLLHFSYFKLIWSSGPHKFYKSRECHTFLLFIPFGPLVLTKFIKAVIAIFFYCWAHLVLWSSGNLQEQRMPHFPTIFPIWSSGPHEIYKNRE